MGTADTVVARSDGVFHGEGKGIVMTHGGDGVTASGMGLGQMTRTSPLRSTVGMLTSASRSRLPISALG